jgi:hypothetical protein
LNNNGGIKMPKLTGNIKVKKVPFRDLPIVKTAQGRNLAVIGIPSSSTLNPDLKRTS